jgi:DNA-binding response OmpR family regulator
VTVRILVSESDEAFGAALAQSLCADSNIVHLAKNWPEAETFLEKQDFDVALLDVSYSGSTHGFEQVQLLRRLRPDLPVLVLISRAQIQDSARLLALGADDFMFGAQAVSAELPARIHAMLQRSARESSLRVDDLELNFANRSATRNGKPIHLTSREFSLLQYMIKNAGREITRDEIAVRAWNLPSAPQTNVVEVYINYLRKKIDSSSEFKLIHTIRGVGYRLTGSASNQYLRDTASNSVVAKSSPQVSTP